MYVTRTEFARLIGRRPQTLAIWAKHKVGPRPRMVRKRAYYDVDEIRAFIEGVGQESPIDAAAKMELEQQEQNRHGTASTARPRNPLDQLDPEL